MIRTTIKCLLAFFAASIMMSCGGKDEGEDYDLGFGMGIRPLTQIDAKVQIMDKSDMPQWLTEKIEEMETGHNSVPWAYVYQGKWNSETILLKPRSTTLCSTMSITKTASILTGMSIICATFT